MNTLIRVSLILVLTTFSLTPYAVAREDEGEYVTAPPESVLLVTASQPDCPLVIERAVLLIGLNPGSQPVFKYRIRNIGKKPVVKYSLTFWSSNGTGGTLGDGQALAHKIESGEEYDSPKGAPRVIPLTNELRNRLKLTGKMQSVTVLMVHRITFQDGTSYSADATSDAIAAFFEKD